MVVPIRPNEINSHREPVKIQDAIISAINELITSQGGDKILIKEKDIKRKSYQIDTLIDDGSFTDDMWNEIVELYTSYGWHVERNILPDEEPYNEDIVFYEFRKTL
jgi:hypothetical protein